MKPLIWIICAVSVVFAGYATPEKLTAPALQPRPESTAPVTSSTSPAKTFAEEIETLLPPKDYRSTEPVWQVRKAEAFTSQTLPRHFSLTLADIAQLRDDIKRWVANPKIPTGHEIKLYQFGVTTLDHWLHYGPNPRQYPPNTSSYYEMIYRDGLTVESYRHDITGQRLAQRVFYSENMIPVCSVNFDADGKPKFFAHLTYDHSGRIKQVVTLDEHGEPFFGTCHAITGIYGGMETISYKMRFFGDPAGHTVNDGEHAYRVEADGTRKEMIAGAPLWNLTRLSKFGVKPFYPLPDDFVVPAFDNRGTPVGSAHR